MNEKGEVLLGKRTDNHMWGYSGGSVEIDEKVEDCAGRELFEDLRFFNVNELPEISPPLRPVMDRYVKSVMKNDRSD